MKKIILKHFTIGDTANITDSSNCQVLEKKLNEAKGKFTLAKKDVKDAKQKLNQALVDDDTPLNSDYWLS